MCVIFNYHIYIYKPRRNEGYRRNKDLEEKRREEKKKKKKKNKVSFLFFVRTSNVVVDVSSTTLVKLYQLFIFILTIYTTKTTVFLQFFTEDFLKISALPRGSICITGSCRHRKARIPGHNAYSTVREIARDENSSRNRHDDGQTMKNFQRSYVTVVEKEAKRRKTKE